MTQNKEASAELARVVELLRKAKAPPISGEFVCRDALWTACIGFLDKHSDLLMAALSSHGGGGEAVYPGERYALNACIWRRDSTQEWVLELTGVINDCSFISRHAQPLNVAPEDVAGLPTLYTTPQPRAEGMVQITDEVADVVLARLHDYAPEGDVWPPTLHRELRVAAMKRALVETFTELLAAAPDEGSGEGIAFDSIQLPDYVREYAANNLGKYLDSPPPASQSATPSDELPELPEPQMSLGTFGKCYTADQMRAYGQLCRNEETKA